MVSQGLKVVLVSTKTFLAMQDLPPLLLAQMSVAHMSQSLAMLDLPYVRDMLD